MKGLPRASWESVHSTVPLLCLVPGMKLAQDRAVSRVHLADPGNEHKEGPKPSGRYGNDQREVWLSFSHRSVWYRMGHRGRRHAGNHYPWRAAVGRLIARYIMITQAGLHRVAVAGRFCVCRAGNHGNSRARLLPAVAPMQDPGVRQRYARLLFAISEEPGTFSYGGRKLVVRQVRWQQVPRCTEE